MPRIPVRPLVLLVAGVAAVVIAFHLATTRPAASGGVISWGAAASPPATAPFLLPTPGTSRTGANPFPNLGQRINDETGAVARGQWNILGEFERAIADQIRGIIQRVEGH